MSSQREGECIERKLRDHRKNKCRAELMELGHVDRGKALESIAGGLRGGVLLGPWMGRVRMQIIPRRGVVVAGTGQSRAIANDSIVRMIGKPLS
ncbi:hypothetical protein R1flu_003879 [Riccia fluitans]|uniref:Uncharacterized protein n=1 Tax=Riccia fluitans TaxID=41844 RepID=A0ABD1YDV9_9MARC